MKKYIIYAGVNGAGKSSLYQAMGYKEDLRRINTDEIVKSFGDWRNPADIMKAGKIAVRLLRDYLNDEMTFVQETTLCGKHIINTIKRAKELGYIIEMHYIGVDSVEIAKERVHNRVALGGHGIPAHDIERRYTESFRALKQVIALCDFKSKGVLSPVFIWAKAFFL